MIRREIEKQKMSQLAQIASGFGNNSSLSHGLIEGADMHDGEADQGSVGLVIPWGGCKHIKILVGSE